MDHTDKAHQPEEQSSPDRSEPVVPTADYRLLFESVPDPCLVLDPKLRIVAVNSAYLRATMTKEEEILGHGIFEVAEQKRERLLLQFESVLESIKEGVVISDLKGNILAMNRQALALHEFGNIEQVRQPLADYWEIFELFDLAGQPVPFEGWPMVRALRGESFVDYELRVRRKDTGRACIVSYDGTLAYDKEGEATLAVITIRDITERKQVEEEIKKLNASLAARAAELEDANRELEAFNYTVAHDLRNPLNVISSYCQAIKELCSDKLDEQCNRYLQETYNGTLRMNRLIEALLQFSRLAHVELKRDRVDLSSMAHEVVGELKGTEAARRVEIRITDGIIADGDAALLRVVLANLLSNAWKYIGKREEGIIEFGVTEVDGKSACFVRDNGPGFDMKDASQLFVPFKRLTGSDECRGFGVGLATVERIIRRHGGRVWAEGKPGKGATFYFTLQ